MKNIAIIVLLILNTVFIYLFVKNNSKTQWTESRSEVMAENFEDLNGNRIYDLGEPFEDSNNNGKYDPALYLMTKESANMKRVFVNGELVEEVVYFEKPQIKEIRKYNKGIKDGDWTIYYKDSPVPINATETISAPHIHAHTLLHKVSL